MKLGSRGAFGLIGTLALPLAGCDVGAPARVDAPADATAGEIDFRLAGPGGAALIVPVQINGEGPWDFVLDTGATVTCVDQEVQDALELPHRRGVVGIGAGIEGTGRLRFARVDSLRVGSATAFDLSVCVLDLQHLERVGATVHGLIGLDFLREFHVTLDFERRVLTLVEPGSSPPS